MHTYVRTHTYANTRVRTHAPSRSRALLHDSCWFRARLRLHRRAHRLARPRARSPVLAAVCGSGWTPLPPTLRASMRVPPVTGAASLWPLAPTKMVPACMGSRASDGYPLHVFREWHTVSEKMASGEDNAPGDSEAKRGDESSTD
eukprot:6187343-Pleurochrysis_carterae.AAC.2